MKKFMFPALVVAIFFAFIQSSQAALTKRVGGINTPPPQGAPGNPAGTPI